MPVEKGGGAGRGSTSAPSTGAGQGGQPDEAMARQQLLQDLERVERRVTDLHGDVRMARVRDELEDLSALLAALPGRLGKVRARGFQFKSFLEKEVETLPAEWRQAKAAANAAIDREAQRLSNAMMQAQSAGRSVRQQAGLPLAQLDPQVKQFSAQVESLQSEVRAAEASVRGMFDGAQQKIRKAERQVADAESMLDELDAASFRLYPGESPIAFAPGEWLKGKDNEVKGLFFLTDHRMLFERKEEVVTKRRLLVFTEKKLERELAVETPVGALAGAEIEKVGTVFKKQVLNLTLTAPPAPFPRLSLALKGDAGDWKGLFGRVITGDIEGERVPKAEGEAAPEPAAPAEPTEMRCSNCGASITVPIVKGMKSISCEYCGNVIRL